VLVLACVAGLALSRLDHSQVRVARGAITEAMAPVLKAMAPAVEVVRSSLQRVVVSEDLTVEIDRLRQRNQELESWRWRAQELERQLAELTRIAHVVYSEPMPFATARVIATSGSFSQAVVIDAGRDRMIRVGYPAINADGLVGRVVDASAASALVLLLSDSGSRVPVHIGTTSKRAILAGDNSLEPKLVFVSDGARIEAGENVFTSGVGGLFPRDLRIGEVVASADGPRVRLRARLTDLEFLTVLYHASPMLELTDGALPPSGPRRALATPLARREGMP